MLQKIRDKSSGWVAGVIVGLLVLTFALWGINSYIGQGSEPIVAVINDTEITTTRFQRSAYNLRQQMQNVLGQSISADDPMFKQQALDRIIDGELIKQASTDHGLRISDQRVYETINSLDMFRTGEGFDPALYQRSLVSMGMTEVAFEQQLRYDMMSEQLQSAVAESAFIIPVEVEQLARLKNQQRSFDYSLVKVSDFMEGIDITEDEISAYYDAHRNNFVQPEQIKIRYLDLTVDKVADQIAITDDETENYFNANRINYSTPERRKIWQAKISIPEEFEGDADTEARKKAEELVTVFETATEFVRVAEEYSSGPDDPILVTISESGEMKKDVLKKEIDDVLFAMSEGDISDPIRSGNAFHVIKLLQILPAEEKELTEVRDRVERDLRRQRAQRKYFDLAEQIAALSYEHPETLEVAADAVELPIEESAYFTREGGGGLLQEPKIIAASFSEEVLINGNNSEPVELDPERMLVLRVADRKAEGTKPLAEVREQIAGILKRERASQKVQETARAILESTGQGNSLEEAAGALEIETSNVAGVNRDDISVTRSVIREAFRMPTPPTGETTIDSITLGTGDVAIIELKAVTWPEDIKGKTIDTVTAELQQLRARMDWDALFGQIKADADIQILKSNLE